MKAYWTDNSIGHLLGIYEYIARNSPVYAKRVVDRITNPYDTI